MKTLEDAIKDGDIKAVKSLIKADVDINTDCGEFISALHLAVSEGKEKIVKFLIRAGADLNIVDESYENVLQLAVAEKRTEIVKILINAGADVNASGGIYGNALQAAALYGSIEIVKMLIEAGADVNASGGHYENALQAAASERSIEIVKMLIEAGADVNASGGFYGNSLQAAASGGSIEIVKMLIEAGADVNASGGRYENALQAAAMKRSIEIVKKLIEIGADVNASGGLYGNALQAAASGGSIEIVEMLIEAGADVNASSERYGNALQAAALGGSIKIVKTLIEAGADVNASGGYYENVLQAAAWGGSIEIVKMFIETGAAVNASGGVYGNALQAAASERSIEIVKMLIEAGADVNASGGCFGNALQAAVATHSFLRPPRNAESEEIVRFLIKAGADLNVLGGEYGSVLQAAVASATHWKDLIKLMLENNSGVVLQSRATDGSSLLHAAVASRELEILNDLFDAGAKNLMNVKDNLGQTPFHAAVISGNLQMLDKLYSFSADSNSISREIDLDGRTLLHLAVEKEAVETVEWLLDRGARADTRDFGDTTPFQLAFQRKNFRILCLLFTKVSEDHKLPSASGWRSIQPKDSGQVIMMIKGKLATVKTISKNELYQYINERSYLFRKSIQDLRVVTDKTMAEDTSEKVIFILEDDSVFGDASLSRLEFRWWRPKIAKDQLYRDKTWIVQPDMVPSVAILRQVPPGECFLECRLGLPVISGTDWEELPKTLESSFERLRTMRAVVWIMVKRKPSATEPDAGRPALETQTYFSTLEYAAVPSAPTDLFVPLVRQLEEDWAGVYAAANEHLDSMRTEVLESNSKLTKYLLRDAKLWGVLAKLLEDQIATLKTLRESYENKKWTVLREEDDDKLEKKIQDFGEEIERLSQRVQSWLGELTASSQTLIQLQFNLTSIAEAQRSTSMNRSVKRLSWITFIFLPLMFIGTLFGMNVDILKSNPHWWLYLLFAAGTTTLTLIVWIAFKRNENLEDKIEAKFGWLVKDTNQDLERSRGRVENKVSRKKPKWARRLQLPKKKKDRDIEAGPEDDEEEKSRGIRQEISEKISKWAQLWKSKRS